VKASASVLPVLRFGVFQFDPRAAELRKKGMKVKLQGQPLDILAILLQRPGETVTREELQRKLWPADTFVDFEQGLNNAMKRLRSALDDDADNPRFVETIPRRGYRFIGQLEGTGAVIPSPLSSDGPPPKRKRMFGPAILGSLVIALIGAALMGIYLDRRDQVVAHPRQQIRSLAVLPLINMSGDPDQEYFADGMTEQLTADLSKIGAVRVISRTSAMRYKGVVAANKSLPEIARELNVDGIVEGSVERAGNRVRITAKLIHAPTDTHLWADSYERNLRDVLSLQDEVARDIASQIRVALTPQEQVYLSESKPIDPEAYEDYLKGRYYFSKISTDGFRQGLRYFQRAVQRDPNYAAAYVGEAECYKYLGFWGDEPEQEANSKARTAIRKALALDDNLGEAHATSAFLHFAYDWDWAAAQAEFNRALELNPHSSDMHLWYAQYLLAMGRRDEGLAEVATAHALDPVSELTDSMAGRAYMLAGLFDQAIEQFQQSVALDPDSAIDHGDIGICYESKGNYPKAVEEYLKGEQVDGVPKEVLAARRRTFLKAGMRGFLQEELNSAQTQFDFANIYARLGDKEHAFEYLDKVYKAKDHNIAFLKVEPLLDNLRSDPRFSDMLRRVGLPQ